MDANRYRGVLFELVLLTWPIVCGQFVAALAEEPIAVPGPDVTKFPDPPKVALAKAKVIVGETDPAEYWSRRTAALVDAASKTENSLEKSRSLLAAANVILSRKLEPFSSLAVLSIEQELTGAEKSSIGTEFGQAEKLIEQANGLLKAQVAPVEPPADVPAEDQPKTDNLKADQAQLLHASELLRAFLDGQRILLLGETDSGSRRRAASAPAPHLEDPDKKVAAAARMWQALLRGLEADPTAALNILDSPMARPLPETWPYGLFSKVLRCRYQGVQGSWSSALVMLVHIEEQLEDWVPDVAHRGDARRFFAYTRLEVLRRWFGAIPPEREADRAWCAGQAQEILKVYFSVDLSLLRLDPAIPMIFPDEVYKAGEAKAASP